MKHRHLSSLQPWLLFASLIVMISVESTTAQQIVDTQVAKSSIDYLTSPKDLKLPLNWVKNIAKQATIGPMIQPIAVFLAKSVVVAFFTAEVLSYMGVIGEPGEGIYEWAVDHNIQLNGQMKKWAARPGALVRHRLYKMLNQYKKMNPKAKFVSSVSTGVTFMPLVIKTGVWTCAISFVVYAVAEFLSLVGVLGDPGEPLVAWVQDGQAEPLMRSIILKRKLKVHELLVGFVNNMKNDRVFWVGFTVGGLASLIIPVYFE
jgi:hypothetical protein